MSMSVSILLSAIAIIYLVGKFIQIEYFLRHTDIMIKGGIHFALVKESKITKKTVGCGQNLAIRIHTENIMIIQGIRQ